MVYQHFLEILSKHVLMEQTLGEINGGHKKHGHKKQIVWKHGPNWPFYALILEAIRLYQA